MHAQLLMCAYWHLAWKCTCCIHGHHVFQMPVINKELVCVQESGNPHDPYVIAFS